MTLLLEANIRLSPTGYSRKNGWEQAARVAANTDECAGAISRPVLSAAMREKVVRREAMSVLAQGGVEAAPIAVFVGCSVSTVRRWILRDAETGDLRDLPRSGRPATYTEDIALKVVAFYCQTRPLPGCGRWTLTWAAAHLAAHPEQVGATPSRSTIHRILRNNKLKPHLSSYFLQITDPDFFPKMEHLVALYKNPPANLFFFDECPGVQILKRLTPDLQTDETRKRLEEFEYIRNGTMDIFAFLTHVDGKVYGECHANHETPTFLGVFGRHVARFPATEQLHYVMDNLSCHRGYPFCQLVAELSGVKCPSEGELNSAAKRAQWLQSESKRIVIHYTPYHGSWLNFVEIWFGIMARKVLGESFGGADALKAAFEAFVEQWNCLLAHMFRWSYDGNGLHEKAVKRFTAMLRDSPEQFEVRILTKMLMLMTNLINDYFPEVPERIWKQFADTVLLKDEIIEDLIEREEGPVRKKKAEQALAAFRATLNHRLVQGKEAAA